MGLRKMLAICIIKQAVRDRGKGLRSAYKKETGRRMGKGHEKITNQHMYRSSTEAARKRRLYRRT
jgi:hypothetical protein